MANVTKNLISGVGAITIDTEVTSGGVYPVEGKGIKSYVDAAITAATPAATTEAAGVVKQAANVEESSATTVAGCKDAINAILSALKEAGIMAPDPEEEET